MSCQHNFIRDIRTSEPFWVCTHCGMEMSADHYQAYQQAHRQGWEQGKRGAVALADELYSPICKLSMQMRYEIGKMEYKEPTK